MINRISSFSQAQNFRAAQNRQYSKIYNHELAHKNAAGSLGGPIVIEKDENGTAIAGHVDIKTPTAVNEKNPQETIDHADKVVDAALAPADPSGQDLKVAAEAKEIKEEAQEIQEEQDDDDDKEKVGSKLNVVA